MTFNSFIAFCNINGSVFYIQIGFGVNTVIAAINCELTAGYMDISF